MQHHTPHWHRGIHAIHFGFLGGLVAVTFLGTMFLSVLSPLWVKQADAAVTRFASGSFWDTTIPSYTSMHPDSSALAANVASQVSSHGASLIKDNGASTVYEVDASVPTVTVVPYDCGSGIAVGLAAQWQSVPIPFYAVPGGSSAQMVVYQPGSSTVWEFGKMQNISGQWQACTGGRINTSSAGVFPSPYGITSSGLAVLAGQLSTQELQSGQINHAVGLSLPQTNGITWPASQYSGSNPGSPPMGQRFRLDPSINVDGLGLSPVAKAIARAGQTYGFVVWNTGGTVGFTAENAASATSRGLPDPYNSLSTGLNGFPWDKLQALPSDYGQAAGIPAITAFSASQSQITADGRVMLTWQANNVTRCAIAGIADNLAASGSVQSGLLKDSATFVLRCGGPLGTATSQVSVRVTPIGSNDGVPIPPAPATINEPYAGYANIFSDLMSGESAQGAYKVVYYEKKTYIYETATPPFALNTLRLDNGPHTINAKVYYQDGHVSERTLGISVNNSLEAFASINQSRLIHAPASIPLLWGVLGGIAAAIVMAAGTLWGWHRAHLLN